MYASMAPISTPGLAVRYNQDKPAKNPILHFSDSGNSATTLSICAKPEPTIGRERAVLANSFTVSDNALHLTWVPLERLMKETKWVWEMVLVEERERDLG